MGLGWLVYQLSESSLYLGYLGAAAGMPAVITTLFGGALADRLDKRLLLMVTSILTAALLALLTWLDYTELVRVWHVIAIAGAISVITGFDWPVRQAIFPALIDRSDMMSAVALTTVIWQATRMVMPAFGGLLIALVDTWLLFGFCSAGFFLMFLVMLNLKLAPTYDTVRHGTLKQIRIGIEYIVTTPLFLILITLSYAMFFFASSYMQLMPAFADLLEVDEKGYGYLLSITGVGAVLGTYFSGSMQASKHLGQVILWSSLIFCVFVYLFALTTWSQVTGAYILSLLIIFSASIFSSVFMVTSTSVLQLEVPDELRGRVMGFHAITYNLLPLGALFAGAIANQSNAPLAISVSTTIYVAFLLWVLFARRDIRSIDGRTMTGE